MKQSLSSLLAKSAESLPPQRPGRFRPLLPLFMAMAERGHTASSIADFLVREREIAPDSRALARRSISSLLSKHAK